MKINRILWGIVLILLGVIIGMNSLGIAEIDIFFKGWWTLFIIIPNFIGLFNKRESLTGNIIGLIIGITLLLVSLEIMSWNLVSSLIIPFILIIIGLKMVLNSTFNNQVSEKFKNFNKNNVEEIAVSFNEKRINKDDEKITSLALDAVFGSINLDLRKAEIDKDCFIKCSNIFAGSKILVPKDVNVKLKSTGIFGGTSNKKDNNKNNKKTIYIESFCLFGGLEINE
ncbi:MAG: cell wall-active antibiotics response protein [Mollicutes bacterium]|nr:cell wall-active antibiotics response protein [Mollicutes bacterium]